MSENIDYIIFKSLSEILYCRRLEVKHMPMLSRIWLYSIKHMFSLEGQKKILQGHVGAEIVLLHHVLNHSLTSPY